MAEERCLCIDLRTAANRLTQIYDEAMADSGMTVTQFSQLHLIQKLGTPTLKELANASELDRSTLGRNVKVLEGLGFVTTQPGVDARTRVLKLSAKGKRAFKKAVPLWYGVQSGLLARLGNEKRRELDNMLSLLTMTTSDTTSGLAH